MAANVSYPSYACSTCDEDQYCDRDGNPTATCSRNVEGGPTVGRADDTIVTCSIKSNLLAALDDSIRAAWNGWEKACMFQDEGMQGYYMKIIHATSDMMKKVKGLKV